MVQCSQEYSNSGDIDGPLKITIGYDQHTGNTFMRSDAHMGTLGVVIGTSIQQKLPTRIFIAADSVSVGIIGQFEQRPNQSVFALGSSDS